MKLSFMNLAYTCFPRWVPSYTLAETIDRLAAIGYDGIEIAAVSPHLWPEYVTDEDLRSIKKHLKDRGLEVAALCGVPGGGPGLNPASPIRKEREKALQYCRDVIRLAADLNCDVVVWVPGWCVFGTSYEQAWNWSLECLKKIAEDAEKTEILIAVEPIDSNETNLVVTQDDGLRMMREAGSKNVKLMVDTYHVHQNRENQTDYIKKWGKDLVHVHISDCNRLPPGKGEINFKSVVKALRAIGYDRYLSVEIFGPDPDGLAQESYDYLKSLITK